VCGELGVYDAFSALLGDCGSSLSKTSDWMAIDHCWCSLVAWVAVSTVVVVVWVLESVVLTVVLVWVPESTWAAVSTLVAVSSRSAVLPRSSPSFSPFSYPSSHIAILPLSSDLDIVSFTKLYACSRPRLIISSPYPSSSTTNLFPSSIPSLRPSVIARVQKSLRFAPSLVVDAQLQN